MTELEIYRRFNLPLIYWKRVGDDPKKWKGPHDRGWNDPERIYDFTHYDPAVHNLGTLTGREISPGKFLNDVDLDKLIEAYVRAFLSAEDDFCADAARQTSLASPLHHADATQR